MKLELTRDVCIDGEKLAAGTTLSVGTNGDIGADVAESILRRKWGRAKRRAQAPAKAKAAAQPETEAK